MGRYDSAWKDIIMAHFFDFLAFYFPEIEKMVDRSQEPEFLEEGIIILSTEDTDKLDAAIDAFVFAETKDEVLCHLA